MKQESLRNTKYTQKILHFRDTERQFELRASLTFCIKYLSIPLYPLFWFLDVFYASEHSMFFLILRGIVVSLDLIFLLIVRNRKINIGFFGVMITGINAIPISIMTSMTGGFNSSYYVGLILIAIPLISLPPWSKAQLLFANFIVWFPYYATNFLLSTKVDITSLLLVSFFTSSTIILTSSLRIILERHRVSELFQRIQLEENRNKLIDLAKSVIHDINSPLTALKALSSEAFSREDDRELLMGSIQRIESIVKNLSKTKKVTNLEIGNVGLAILTIVKEKEAEYYSRDVSITYSGARHDQFVPISTTDLSRVLSNIINNSFEAIESEGKIEIEVISKNGIITVIVEDDGVGVELSSVPDIFKSGFSLKGERNKGLGLSLAKETLEEYGGSISFEPKVPNGARVRIDIPVARIPDWSINSLDLKEKNFIFLIENITSIKKLKEKFSHCRSITFSDSDVEVQSMIINLERSATVILEPKFLSSLKLTNNQVNIVLIYDTTPTSFQNPFLGSSYKILPLDLLPLLPSPTCD